MHLLMFVSVLYFAYLEDRWKQQEKEREDERHLRVLKEKEDPASREVLIFGAIGNGVAGIAGITGITGQRRFSQNANSTGRRRHKQYRNAMHSGHGSQYWPYEVLFVLCCNTLETCKLQCHVSRGVVHVRTATSNSGMRST